MAEVTINLSDYKASGVYFLEVDNSIITSTNINSALRLAAGFNMSGPFNRPVYLSSSADCDELIGPVDRKLERKGCFTNRNIRTMVNRSPVFAINLLPVNTRDIVDNPDVVGVNALSLDANKDNIASKAMFAKMYNRRRFWVADENELVNAVSELKDEDTGEFIFYNGDKMYSPLFSVGNCGTSDISLIIRKAENLNGYNVTFRDWYGSDDAIPYKWINPNDYVVDYFVQVIAVSGNWNDEQYKAFASDSMWKEFFTENGLKKEKLNKFLRLDAVNVVGNWVGCILPNFYDKQGKMQSIEYKINSYCNKTGLLFGTNETALDALCLGNVAEEGEDEKYGYFIDINGDGIYNNDEQSHDGSINLEGAPFIPDLVGNMVTGKTMDPSIGYLDFLSYHITEEKFDDCVFVVEGVEEDVEDPDASVKKTIPTQFVVYTTQEEVLRISVGDFVRNNKGLMTRIIKKRSIATADPDGRDMVKTVFTAATPVGYITSEDSSALSVEIHKAYSEMYDTLKFLPVTGLKLSYRHMPGYDASGNIDYEGGVEKIYHMLTDEGIRRGLLNNNMINFRYIIDTMAYGLGDKCKGKKYLSELAMSKMRTTALCNLPSMSQFAASDEPFFGSSYVKGTDGRPTFDISYIKDGGNQDMAYSTDIEFFSLPGESEGSMYCGYFTPFLKYTEGVRTILVPPAADVSNTFMNKFLGGDPYKTVANLNGIISNRQVNGVEYDFDESERGVLENMGINPIINDMGVVMIYGDRTAYQDVNSDLNFLHTRELLNTIEIECGNVLKDYVFTFNNAATRSEIAQRINPILAPMVESGALAKYDLQIDENNNPKEIIDEKFAFVDIGVWVTQNMEKIICRVTINRSTTAYE